MALSDNMRGIVYINVAMLAFTVNDTCMKAVTQTMPLFQAIALRGLVATVALVMIARLTGGLRLWPGRRDGVVIGVRTVAEVLSTLTFLAALVHMPLANLSAIMQSLPLAVTLAAALAFGEPIGWRRLVAICIGFIGVLIIIRPGTEGFDRWSILGLLSVAGVVVRDLATRKLSAGVPSTTVAVWASLSVTVMGLAGLAQEGWQPVTGAELVYLAIASGNLIVGYLFVVKMMRTGNLGLVAPFRYTALLWAILFGWLLFGTFPDGWTILGAVIVVVMGIFTLWREHLANRARRAG
jgi:drug/metabolite transporter (DMT)-like permease